MLYTIIGAGIGGLTTAIAFEKYGIEYQLFEKAPALNEVGAGIWLAPNALQVLEHLDILEEIKTKGNSIDRITIGKPDLSSLSDTLQNEVKDTFGYSTIAIHRATLQQLLIEKLPQEKIHLGKAFKESKELNSGRIEITFDDNSTFETDFVIGADGIHSKVRNQIFPESKTRYSGQTCWRGISDYKIPPDFEHRGIELWGNQIRFGISKVAKDKTYWFAVVLSNVNKKDKKELTKDTLLRKFSDFDPLIERLISGTPHERIVKNDIIDLAPLDNWYKNSICLIGDAGHATTPNMGQGGAQAIEDAYYLSNLINDKAGENTFRLFQQKRKTKVNQIVKKSWSMGKIAHWKYGKGLRNFVLKNAPQSIMKKQMMKMYHIEKIG
ncbi:FAD-dependent monooxygenase [Aquimarina sediminis]|uniref:FAD-dependent monooxygenase n=1 Tax=Aquimarina sediminis TaxID=2070536 RepID=UPI000CA044FF|nr:FAD-dependent monooxygenase [Aquimarina sediminis]